MFIKSTKNASYKTADLIFDGQFNIDSCNYEIEEKIGSGLLSDIYKVKNINDGNVYAAKVITSGDDSMICKEISLLKKCQHPTIIKFYGVSPTDFNKNGNYTIFMDFAVNGSLHNYITDYSLDNTQRQIILSGIAYAMMFIHKNKIIHLDLKPQNVLLDKNNFPLITDFGISQKLCGRMNTKLEGGSSPYMAPELFADEVSYNEKADVYSFGILMFEVILRKRAYVRTENHKWTDFKIAKNVSEGYRPKFKHGIKKSLKTLIKRCWSSDISIRPSFEEIFVRLTENNRSYHFDKNKLEETEDEYEDEGSDDLELSDGKNLHEEKNADNINNVFEEKNTKYHLKGVNVNKLRDYIKYIKLQEMAESSTSTFSSSSPSLIDELNLSGYKNAIDLRRIRPTNEEETEVVQDASDALESLRKKYDTLINDMRIEHENDIEHQEEKLVAKINAIQKENSKLKKENVILKNATKNDELKENLISLQEKYAKIIEENGKLKDNLNSLQEKYDKIFDDYENLQTENENLERQNRVLNTEKENLNERYDNLKTENENLVEQNRNVRTEYRKLEEQIRNARTQNRNFDVEIGNLRMQNQNLEEQNEILNVQKDNLTEQNENLRKENQELKEENENRAVDATNRKRYLEDSNRQLIQEKQNLTKSVNDLIRENSILKQQQEKLHSKFTIKKSKSKGSVRKTMIIQNTANDTKTTISNSIFKQAFIDGFNSLDIRSQTVFISDVIKKSECSNLIDSLKKISSFLNYLLQFVPVPEDLNTIKIYTEDSDKYHSNFEGLFMPLNRIYIKNEATSIITQNECFRLKEFYDIIEKFDFMTIELKYPSDNFDDDYDSIVTYIKAAKIAVLISDMNETDLKFKDNEIIDFVRFDNDVTAISENSYRGCKSLKRAFLSSKIESIGRFSFSLCTSLSFISIPSSVKTIEAHAFECCTNLKEVIINNQVQSIKSCCFCGCESLLKVKMPTLISKIENQTFYNCKSLKSIIITAKVSEIEEEAFANCESLEEIKFVSFIKTNDNDDIKLRIGERSFKNCKNLNPFKFSTQLDSVAESAFEGCTKLMAVTFKSMVSYIGKNAFLDCNIEEVTVPPQFMKDYEKIFNRKNRKELGIKKEVQIYDK